MWIRYYSAGIGSFAYKHQDMLRSGGFKVTLFYCEYKKKLLPNPERQGIMEEGDKRFEMGSH
jgi:hypothetical protein